MDAGDPLPLEFAGALAAARIGCRPLGDRVIFFKTIGSTNDVALDLAARGGHEGTIVMADAQTAGRGRHGRAWFSPPGSGLYVSIVLRPSDARRDPRRATSLLTLAAGWRSRKRSKRPPGCAPTSSGRTICSSGGESWPASWPNRRRAIAGRIVLGYGINVSARAYPPELGDRATSLETELGRPIDRAVVCVETLAAVSARYRDLLAGRFDAILDGWRSRAPASRGARVTWRAPSGPEQGVTAGIDDRGALLVRVGDRIETIVGGEVTWL